MPPSFTISKSPRSYGWSTLAPVLRSPRSHRQASVVSREEVLDALSSVRDPELDEPLTSLGFVSALEIEDDSVNIRLRLPTYFCAPNCAYLMVADARAAALSVPDVH